jgi:hypothetical protein
VVMLVKPLRHQSSLRLKRHQPKLHQLTMRLRAPKSQSRQLGTRPVGRV